MRRAGRRQRLAQDLLDGRPRGGAGLVLRELDADALRAVALHAFGRDPDDLALHGDPVGIVHQRQQHEHFLAERVLPRRRDEDAAALEERHVRGVQRRPLADVERQHAGARARSPPSRRPARH